MNGRINSNNESIFYPGIFAIILASLGSFIQISIRHASLCDFFTPVFLGIFIGSCLNLKHPIWVRVVHGLIFLFIVIFMYFILPHLFPKRNLNELSSLGITDIIIVLTLWPIILIDSIRAGKRLNKYFSK